MPSNINISPLVAKSLKNLSRFDRYVIISSSSFSFQQAPTYPLSNEINQSIWLSKDVIRSLRGKSGVFSKKKLQKLVSFHKSPKTIIHLPHQKDLRPGEYRRLIRQLFNHISDYESPILPVYYYKSQNQKTYIRIGSLLKYNTSAQHTRNYVLAQLNALHINLNQAQNQSSVNREFAEIIDPISSETLTQEIKTILQTDLVFQRAHFQVFISQAQNIPNILKEIGRLREITFREVDEGTGKSFDLDDFDLYYLQLFIWDKDLNKIVGGYRLGLGDKIIAKYGIEGTYISKLFKIKSAFTPIMIKSIEMGRSFVVPEYQKQRLPLFLLWRGILELLIKNPQYKYLYGPVSISKFYSNISKSLIISFIKKNYYNTELAKLLKPQKPYKFKYKKKEFDALIQTFDGEVSELDQYIENIEPTHLRLPVLIKQYIKQNARFIGFNLDPNFSDALDGFVLLNLNDFPESTMEMLKNEKLK